MHRSLASRWEKARKDTQGLRAWRRELVPLFLTAIIAYFAIRWLASPQGATEEVIAIIVAMIVTVIVVPVAEFVSNFRKAPLRLAEEEIARLGYELNVEREQRKVIEARFEPHLSLTYDPQDGNCREDVREADATAIGSGFRILRLRLENKGAMRLDRVRILVEGIGQATPWAEQPLQFQRDVGSYVYDPIAGQYRKHFPESNRGFDLAPHEQTYVNLLFKKESGQGSDQFDLFFANPIPSEIPAAQAQLDVVAYADNAPPARAVAHISLDEMGRPICELEVKSV